MTATTEPTMRELATRLTAAATQLSRADAATRAGRSGHTAESRCT
ncbi:hypothetical protein [Nocardia transvalensis]|nr:hypothetical protein [Nocardia transvalensis]